MLSGIFERSGGTPVVEQPGGFDLFAQAGSGQGAREKLSDLDRRMSMGDLGGWLGAKAPGEDKMLATRISMLSLPGVALPADAAGKIDKLVKLMEANPKPTPDVIAQASQLVGELEKSAGQGGGATSFSGSLVESNSAPGETSHPPKGEIDSYGRRVFTSPEAKAVDSFAAQVGRRGGEERIGSPDAHFEMMKRLGALAGALQFLEHKGKLTPEDRALVKTNLAAMQAEWDSGSPRAYRMFEILNPMLKQFETRAQS